MKKFACLFLVLAASGCPDIKTDPADENAIGPVVEFDPGNRIVPFPNNLLLDPATGKVNMPAQCGESPAAKAIREGVLNQLDGFGTFEGAMQVTFSEEVDMASLTDKIVVYKIASAGTPVSPADATPIPTVAIKGTTARFDAACANPTAVQSLTIVPRVPLEQKSTYAVALLEGIKTASGEPLGASFTWTLVRAKENPVTIEEGVVISDRTPLNPADPEDLATLKGIDLLWKVHSGPLMFLEAKGHKREQTLLAWSFNTQTTTDPLDPGVAGSLAASINTGPLLGPIVGGNPLAAPISVTAVIDRANPPYSACDAGDNNTQCFLKMSLGSAAAGAGASPVQVYQAGSAVCASVGCAAVGDVLAGTLKSKSYQAEKPNPMAGGRMIPGAWGNPVNPTMVKEDLISAFAIVPAAACPASGCKTVIFGHGLGQSKTNVFAIAPQLAAQGHAVVAIDHVAHDSRAVRVSNTGTCADGGTGAPSPVRSPQCYAPFLSPDLGTTRDNIRQTVLDLHGLTAALKSCGAAGCGALKVDAAKIQYMGQSLGGIIGSTLTATNPDLKASVLNVPGVGWVDILENTETLAIRCMLVDGLIDATILTGDKWNPTAMTGLCTTDAWKAQPGYRQFSMIGRWVLDPADPANFTRKLAPKKFLIQEVVGDTVVPNVATMNEGLLVGQTAATADPATSATPMPSAAITTNPTASKWVQYPTITTPAPNIFGHGSLLQPPALSGTGGQLGTVRMQTDAITFLVLNNQ
ncbi:MAG: hypothetical protein ACTHU0_12160 [Kofleriaceae bacterium]